MKTMRKPETFSLYSNIRDLCGVRKLTVAELERATGLGNGVVRKWNSASPTLRTLIAVADYLNVSLDELVRPQRK